MPEDTSSNGVNITGGTAGAVDPDSYNQACKSDNACEASWIAAYQYAADKSYDLAKYQALQALIMAGIQYASADRTADKMWDIANRQMVIAEAEWARYKEIYKPCEDALAAEICALECEEVDYEFYADRAQRDVSKQFSLAQEKLARTRSRYCTSDYLKKSCDLAKSEALATVATRDIAYRVAEARNDALNERRWSRRIQMFDLGRSIQTGQMGDYSGAMPGATAALNAGQSALDNLLGTISGSIGGLLNANFQPKIYAPQIYNGFKQPTAQAITQPTAGWSSNGVNLSSNTINMPPPRPLSGSYPGDGGLY